MPFLMADDFAVRCTSCEFTWNTPAMAEGLRVRALVGSTFVPWSRVAELAPDPRGRISALLTDGNVLRLTGVTTGNLAVVLAAGGQEVSNPPTPD